jgi:oligosaccharide repeat unit polymerase
MYLLLLTTILISSLSSRFLTKTKYWINPITVLCVPHFILLCSYLLALRRGVVTLELSQTTILIFGLGYTSFIIAVLLCSRILHQRHKISVDDEILRSLNSISILKRNIYFSLWILLLSVIYKYYLLILTYGNPLSAIISIRLDYLSGKLDYGLFNQIAFLGSFILVLNLALILAIDRKKVSQVYLFASFLLLITNDLSIGGVNWTFSNISLLTLTWLITRAKLGKLKLSFNFLTKNFKRIRKLLVRGSIFIFLVFSMLYFRSQGSIGKSIGFFDTFLYYSGGNIATFQYFYDNPYLSDPPGRFTFGGIYRIFDFFQGGSFLPENINPNNMIAFISENTEYTSTSNTSIHFTTYYADFGIFGTVILSFLLGFVSMWMMSNYLKSFSLIRVQYFSLALFNCFMSIRGVPTEGIYFFILIILIPFISIRFRRHWSLKTLDC